MRPEKLYLIDIVEAVDAIERFLNGMDSVSPSIGRLSGSLPRRMHPSSAVMSR